MREWQQRLEQMKRCSNVTELVAQHGQPHHKEQHDSMEIWHYPLGINEGVLYSIHTAILSNQSMQVYMHMEPTSDTSQASQRRPWWMFWSK